MLTSDFEHDMDYPGVGATVVNKAVAHVGAGESAISIKKGSLIFGHADGYADNVPDSNVQTDEFVGIAREAVEIEAVAAGGDPISKEFEVVKPHRVWIPHAGAVRSDVFALFSATDDDTLVDGAANSNGEVTIGRCIDVNPTGTGGTDRGAGPRGSLLIDTTDKG